MADTNNEETGATAVTRAVNKLKSIQKALTGIPEAHKATALVLKAIADMKPDALSAFEAALSRRRSNEFSPGDSVKPREEFVKLFGKGPFTVKTVETHGGDDNGRGGRSFVKAAGKDGNTMVFPASSLEMA